MKSDRGDLLRGALEMLILRSLEGGAMHGYGITEHLQRISKDVLSVEEGSLYPALYRMQARGLVRSSWGRSENNRRARFYSITPEGRRHLEASARRWGEFSKAVARVMTTSPRSP